MNSTHKKMAIYDSHAKQEIVVLDNDRSQSIALCGLLADRGYQTIPAWSLSDLNLILREKSCPVVLVDLDTISLDNRTIRDLTQKYPGTYFLCLSSGRFHPELKDAIRYHFYACIHKPFDPEEIFYWLKSIYENESN